MEKIVFEEDSELSEIAKNAFKGCTSLRLVIIPESTEIVAGDAFPENVRALK